MAVSGRRRWARGLEGARSSGILLVGRSVDGIASIDSARSLSSGGGGSKDRSKRRGRRDGSRGGLVLQSDTLRKRVRSRGGGARVRKSGVECGRCGGGIIWREIEIAEGGRGARGETLLGAGRSGGRGGGGTARASRVARVFLCARISITGGVRKKKTNAHRRRVPRDDYPLEGRHRLAPLRLLTLRHRGRWRRLQTKLVVRLDLDLDVSRGGAARDGSTGWSRVVRDVDREGW
jgi:hypothetical protein